MVTVFLYCSCYKAHRESHTLLLLSNTAVSTATQETILQNFSLQPHLIHHLCKVEGSFWLLRCWQQHCLQPQECCPVELLLQCCCTALSQLLI
jgi:hypothetical protein